MTVRIGKRKVPVPLSDVEWLCCTNEDGTEETETELIISGFGDDLERATRLVSELRCCGMVANVERYDDEAAPQERVSRNEQATASRLEIRYVCDAGRPLVERSR
jgi:hypothetical protein